METTALTIKRLPAARESFSRAVKIRETWRVPTSTAASYMVTKATLTAPFETGDQDQSELRRGLVQSRDVLEQQRDLSRLVFLICGQARNRRLERLNLILSLRDNF